MVCGYGVDLSLAATKAMGHRSSSPQLVRRLLCCYRRLCPEAVSHSTNLGDDDVGRALPALQPPPGPDQRGCADDAPRALIGRLADDQVDSAALVFEQHEGDALGGLRALAGDHHSCDFDRLAVRDLLQIAAATHLPPQRGPQEP